MQLMTLSSEEGEMDGFGWIKASVKRFSPNKEIKLKVPHIGWNNVEVLNPHPITDNITVDSKFYFVHSYHVVCEEQTDVISRTHYDISFDSIIAKDNIYGCQFHPEKSHKHGMKIFRKFSKHLIMLQNRIMPCLLLKDTKLVKTIRFKNAQYIGDPVNAIKIFNEKEVDELIVADISANREIKGPNFDLIKQFADECFMPVCYGGGISTVEQIRKILKIGIEKVVLNSALYQNRNLIKDASKIFGSQCIVVSLDIQKNWIGKVP